MVIFVKLIALTFAAISITKSYLDYKKKLEPRIMFLFWTVIWLVAATLAVFPVLIERIVNASQDQNITVGSFITIAFVFMLFIVYRVYAKASRVEYRQAELIRLLGLNQALKKKKK